MHGITFSQNAFALLFAPSVTGNIIAGDGCQLAVIASPAFPSPLWGEGQGEGIKAIMASSLASDCTESAYYDSRIFAAVESAGGLARATKRFASEVLQSFIRILNMLESLKNGYKHAQSNATNILTSFSLTIKPFKNDINPKVLRQIESELMMDITRLIDEVAGASQ